MLLTHSRLYSKGIGDLILADLLLDQCIGLRLHHPHYLRLPHHRFHPLHPLRLHPHLPRRVRDSSHNRLGRMRVARPSA